MMQLNHSKNGRLEGKYSTAVEVREGSSGGSQIIHGRVGEGMPTTFGLTVTFKVNSL